MNCACSFSSQAIFNLITAFLSLVYVYMHCVHTIILSWFCSCFYHCFSCQNIVRLSLKVPLKLLLLEKSYASTDDVWRLIYLKWKCNANCLSFRMYVALLADEMFHDIVCLDR